MSINLIATDLVSEADAVNLHPNDKRRLDERIHHEHKRKEFIASRTALRLLKPEYMLHYEGRCPILDGPGYISLAHSQEYGAAIHHPTRRVGIDVEPQRPKLSRLARKFLNLSELDDVDRGHSQFKLQILWGAKEALFKLHRMGGIEFKKHLFIDPITVADTGTVDAAIVTEDENIPCKIGWFFHANQYVVYAVSEIPLSP
ncbi:MAG: 4'-phosphopantetheinyl transferase superfamily protein [Flavobacteriia bacterium]|nr:4'-phosphopantetheinyl transferase superfamily protein [Flavobacteriia bacterium]